MIRQPDEQFQIYFDLYRDEEGRIRLSRDDSLCYVQDLPLQDGGDALLIDIALYRRNDDPGHYWSHEVHGMQMEETEVFPDAHTEQQFKEAYADQIYEMVGDKAADL